MSAEPNVVERESAEAELREENGAGGVEALDDGGVFLGNAIAERLRAIGGGNAGGVEKILAAPGNAVKRTAIFSGGDFCVGLFGLGEGEIAGEGDDAAELGIELLDAAQIDVREALGGEFALFDPARELGDWGEGDVGVVGGKRAGIGFGANELIALWAAGWPGRTELVARPGRESGFEGDGARAGAAFVNGGQVDAPGVCGYRRDRRWRDLLGRVFRLRRKSRARPRGRRRGRCRRRAARREEVARDLAQVHRREILRIGACSDGCAENTERSLSQRTALRDLDMNPPRSIVAESGRDERAARKRGRGRMKEGKNEYGSC